MSGADILLAVGLGLAANELCDVSPWVARKLVRWSARYRYADPARAEIRAEELAAVIDDRPGKLFKLLTALGFTAVAVAAATARTITDHRRRSSADIMRWVVVLSGVLSGVLDVGPVGVLSGVLDVGPVGVLSGVLGVGLGVGLVGVLDVGLGAVLVGVLGAVLVGVLGVGLVSVLSVGLGAVLVGVLSGGLVGGVAYGLGAGLGILLRAGWIRLRVRRGAR